jgi:uncharacterized protein with GYD domain
VGNDFITCLRVRNKRLEGRLNQENVGDPLHGAVQVHPRRLGGIHKASRGSETPAVEALAEKLGCQFEAFYYSLGEYDGDAPDEATVSAFVLAAIAPGHINATKTTVLMTPGAMFDAMKKASLAGYKGPRK